MVNLRSKTDSGCILPPATQANSNVFLVSNRDEVLYVDDFMSENFSLALVSLLDIDWTVNLDQLKIKMI